MPTKISWTDESWNPVVGCTKVSEGCKNCYAEKMAIRLNGIFAAKGDDDNWAAMANILKWDYSQPDKYEFGRATGWNGQVELFYSRLDQPLHWRNPRRIFVCSMSDLFHPAVPFEFIKKVRDVATVCQQHTLQFLTKRADRLLKFTQWLAGHDDISIAEWPRNCWLGVSVENQKRADERIPILLQIPAAVRFVSIEPMLGKIDITDYLGEYIGSETCHYGKTHRKKECDCLFGKPDWVIIGCESLGGSAGRECKLEWVRDIVEQCKAARVKVFVKQLSINGKVEDDIAKFPKDLQIQEYPDVLAR